MPEYIYKLRNKESGRFYQSRHRSDNKGAPYNRKPNKKWAGRPEDWEVVKYEITEVSAE